MSIPVKIGRTFIRFVRVELFQFLAVGEGVAYAFA